eukprot:Phypoly_transcript_14217.p1 GENE.Phypoly_transcript_14217~~Phypoly_transcript_14217.p1  ORF type:complete len:271 (+),score=41.32 Phypoly_transcript_14217:141-953(+)
MNVAQEQQHMTNKPQLQVDSIVDDDLLEAASISDTQVGLSAGLASFPKTVFPNTPPIVLVSQLYSSVTNRTDVDRELDNLKREGSIRVFKLLSGKNDYAVVTREDYIASIRKFADYKSEQEIKPSVFEKFIENVLPNYNDVQIHKTKLLELLFGTSKSSSGEITDSQKDGALTTLVNASLLLVYGVDNFWFCIPNAGLFVASLVKGRKEIISVLKRQKFKELLLSDLQKKKLRYSSLSMDFLVKDMNGLNIIERVPTTTGFLIRLIDTTM